jgi:hypothetical protein
VRVRDALAICFAVSLVGTVNATEGTAKRAASHRHRYGHHRIPAAPDTDAARTVEPRVSGLPKPVLSSLLQNDSDGLSRDPEDCNKGCLDNTQ